MDVYRPELNECIDCGKELTQTALLKKGILFLLSTAVDTVVYVKSCKNSECTNDTVYNYQGTYDHIWNYNNKFFVHHEVFNRYTGVKYNVGMACYSYVRTMQQTYHDNNATVAETGTSLKK